MKRDCELYSKALNKKNSYFDFYLPYCVTLQLVILSFKHKGLQIFWERGIASKLPGEQRNKIRLILDAINEAAIIPQDLVPFKNWKIHPLKGEFKGYWSVTVKENWRIIFKFDGKNAMDIDFIDYH
jgi:proteic killer suppression protein